MSGFIPKKLSFFLFLGAWSIAVGVIFLLIFASSAPKLGPSYDILLGFRPPPPVSGEILLIETEDSIEPGDVFSVLMTLSEADASGLLIEVPVLGSGGTESGTELNRRVNDEFALVGRNIRSLFEGIRMGTIQPWESDAYVDSLVELSERGRDRLTAAIIRERESGSTQAGRAAAVFGKSFSALDLRTRNQEGIPWYSRPEPDKDGILRRIAPVITLNDTGTEHIVYHAFKERWEKSVFDQTETGTVLENRFNRNGEEIVHRFPLDKNGNILFERTDDFRRLHLNDFLRYERAERAMEHLLKEMETPGVYAFIEPERIPSILFTYSEVLKEDLLTAPDYRKFDEWKSARTDYFNSLFELLYGPSETTLVSRYDDRIARERRESVASRLRGERDELIKTFAAFREKHRELVAARTVLMEALDASFCIMGPVGGTPTGTTAQGPLGATAPANSKTAGKAKAETSIPESSALLANALLTGRCITPGRSLHILIWSLAISFAVLAYIHALGPGVLFLAGLSASLLCGAGFGVSFILTSYWIDPLIPASACLSGTLFMATLKFSIGRGRALRFKMAYSPMVNKPVLKALVKEGPPLSETVCVYTAVIAVKNPVMYRIDDTVTPLEASSAAAEFRKVFTMLFKQAGALILGFEGGTAMACFGSPPERIFLGKAGTGLRYSNGPNDTGGVDPAKKAIRCVEGLINFLPCADWHFGIESGKCAFSRTGESGVIANGLPVTRAKMYASVASRIKARAVVGETVKRGARTNAKRLPLRDSGSGTAFNCWVVGG